MLSRMSQVGSNPPWRIPIVDIPSYLDSIRERAGITDQNALASCNKTLARQLRRLSLGSVNRMSSRIRLVA